jgi:intracellular multiplication protein IcmD
MPDEAKVGEIADNVTASDVDLTKVITGASYAAGAGEAVVETEKFKMHKDNPTQIPISKKE